MSAFTKLFGVSLAVALAASVASAATVTYSTPVDFAGIPVTDTNNFSGSFGPGVGPAGNGGGEALPFKQFDPAYGTLTGVSITVTGYVGTNTDVGSFYFGRPSSVVVRNTSAGDQNYHEDININLYLMDNNPTCLDSVENDFLTHGVTEANSGCMLSSLNLNFTQNELLHAGDVVTHTLSLSQSMSAFSGIAGTISNLTGFVGTGSLPLQIFLESSNSYSVDAGNAVVTPEAFAGASASITYTYDAAETPEPGSMFLMGGALLGIGFLRRKLTR